MRGMPAGFGGQQQPQQPGRSVSNRIPNGGKTGMSSMREARVVASFVGPTDSNDKTQRATVPAGRRSEVQCRWAARGSRTPLAKAVVVWGT